MRLFSYDFLKKKKRKALIYILLGENLTPLGIEFLTLTAIWNAFMSFWMTEDLGWILLKRWSYFCSYMPRHGFVDQPPMRDRGAGEGRAATSKKAEDLHEMSRTRADKQSKKLAQRIRNWVTSLHALECWKHLACPLSRIGLITTNRSDRSVH